MNDSDIEEMEAEIAAEKSAGEYDDGMDDREPDDLPQPEEDPQADDQPPEDDEQPAEESLLINNTNKLKSYKRGKK